MNSLTDFIKTDLEQVIENKGEYCVILFEIWKQLVIQLEKASDNYYLFFAFLTYNTVSYKNY